jgi:hypothetical protein
MVVKILAAAFGLFYLLVAAFMFLFVGLMAQGAVILLLKYFGIEYGN